ncbi:hypothetical protein K0U00_23155, partial [Paenibacillus sepulcri]|nr:hypothetical protein [Paenibacillus sepulcri]
MTYRQRLFFLIFMDSFIVLTAIFFSRFLVSATLNVFTVPIISSSIVLLLSHHGFAFLYKLYKKAWEYASFGELLNIAKAITLSIVTAACIQQLLYYDVYFRLLGVTWMLHILLIGSSRLCWRLLRDTYIGQQG